VDQTAATFLDKSQRSLQAAELLLAAGHPDFAASRAYYVMLYAADALLSAECRPAACLPRQTSPGPQPQ